jgi:hypothetical protein
MRLEFPNFPFRTNQREEFPGVILVKHAPSNDRIARVWGFAPILVILVIVHAIHSPASNSEGMIFLGVIALPCS